jgi:hypothetical protein
MRTAIRWLFLLVLALFVFAPVVHVEAADGTGQEVADTAQGWLEAVLLIGGIILVVAGLVFLLAVGRKYYARLAVLLPQVDRNRAVVAFGQSIPGKAANDALSRFLPQVDDPSDPLIQRLEATKLLRWLHKQGLLDGADLSKFSAALVADGIKLTNGVPDVEFNLLNYDSTQARG